VSREGREDLATALGFGSLPTAETAGEVPPSSVFPSRKGIVQPAMLGASGSKLAITPGFRDATCRVGRNVHFIGSSCCPSLMTSKCRWHPVEDPVVPTSAITSPTRT
jgi:hypothetical protein